MKMNNKKKVLIIDDDPDFVIMTKELLSHGGYEVYTAGSGDEGLEKVRNIALDLILLDIIMPVKDGLEVLYELRNNFPDIGEIPVIMITGKKEMESVFQARGFGASDYIVKPFNAKELLEIVAKYIGT